MSSADYEAILRERGFALETSDFLPRPTLGISNAAYRSVVATGRKSIDGATVVVQLQDSRSVNGSGYECIARVEHPDIVGAGMLRPRPLWGTYKALTAGPKVAVFLLALFMLAGVWVVMLPGALLVLSLRVGALKKLRIARFRELVIPRAASRFDAPADWARTQGIRAYVLGDDLEGESRDLGEVRAAIARSVARHETPFEKPCVILSGGETTVTLARREDGTVARGGRATEFLLGCAIALRGEANVYVLAADTDGIDGVMDNAGAIITPDTLARAETHGLHPREMLDRNDAYDFFASIGDLVVTGPTFTNVNDFRAVLIV